MKLLQYPFNCHDKNKESMIRMCKVFNIEFEATNDRNRIKEDTYDILWLPTEWIEPNEIPLRVKILYGPQHFVFPDPLHHRVCVPKGPEDPFLSKRAFYICLSNWIEQVFLEFSPSFRIPLKAFPFGVKELPQRNLTNVSYDCIFYSKRRDPALYTSIKQTLQDMNLTFREFSYGSYRDSDYQDALQKTKLIVWLGCHESQGFAFQEAMSRNIPILVLDVESMFDEWNVYNHLKGQKQLKATTASWWCDKGRCGEKLHSTEEFETTLRKMLDNIEKYSPASFVKENLSDEVCMKRILDTFNQS